MTEKKKISYEQDLALAAGRSTARANQRRRTAANAAADKAQAERERLDAEQAERDRELRMGFDLGDRVTGRDRTWGKARTGVVIAGPPSEKNDGVHIEDADGNTWVLGRYTVESA